MNRRDLIRRLSSLVAGAYGVRLFGGARPAAVAAAEAESIITSRYTPDVWSAGYSFRFDLMAEKREWSIVTEPGPAADVLVKGFYEESTFTFDDGGHVVPGVRVVGVHHNFTFESDPCAK